MVVELWQLEECIRSGNISAAQSLLDKLEIAKIKRSEFLGYANIARRAGYHRLAFRILNPIVRPKNKVKTYNVSPEELVEYGLCLSRLGVIDEARKVLSQPATSACPERHLYLAFTYFSEWQYEKGRDLLMDYLATNNLDPYYRLIGMVNLGQAYLGMDQPENAIEWAQKAISTAKDSQFNLITANALQTLADAFVDLKDFKKAKEALKSFQEFVSGNHFRYDLYIQKLSASINNSVREIQQVGIDAKSRRASEIWREAQLIEAVMTRNISLFEKVYFGTPYPEYRERMLRHWGGNIEFGQNYLWQLNPNSRQKGFTFDIINGVEVETGKKLKNGTAIHRLLCILASNLFRTFKAESLFSQIHPGENLLESSVHRVHNVVTRARAWLEEEKINFTIEESYGEYCLSSSADYKLLIPKTFTVSKDIGKGYLNELQNQVQQKFFNIADVVRLLKVSQATANRCVRGAVDNDLVEKIGQSRSTKYRFKKVS